MGRKTFTPEQIIFKLREAELLVGQGESIAAACRKIAVPVQSCYSWRKGYGVLAIRLVTDEKATLSAYAMLARACSR